MLLRLHPKRCADVKSIYDLMILLYHICFLENKKSASALHTNSEYVAPCRKVFLQ